MKYIIIAMTLLSSQVFAKEITLNCSTKVNSEKVSDTHVVLKPGQSNVNFGAVDGFSFLLSSKANNVIELQLYNVDEPSRTYATAPMKGAGSFVELSQWKREFILDLRCEVL